MCRVHLRTKSFNSWCISLQGILRIKLISCSKNSLACNLLNSFDGCSTFFEQSYLLRNHFLWNINGSYIVQNHHGASHYAIFIFLCLSLSLGNHTFWYSGRKHRCIAQTYDEFLNYLLVRWLQMFIYKNVLTAVASLNLSWRQTEDTIINWLH